MNRKAALNETDNLYQILLKIMHLNRRNKCIRILYMYTLTIDIKIVSGLFNM